MDEFVDVRPDVSGFARDVAEMRAALENGLGTGADRAGQLIERGLARAIRSGKFGFDDLRATALSTLNEIAAATVRSGLSALIGGGSGGGLVSLGSAVVGALTGLPGRAYVVGERGPELFVPTSSGAVSTGGGGARDVRVSIAINAPAGAAPDMLARSGRQVARAVRAALSEE